MANESWKVNQEYQEESPKSLDDFLEKNFEDYFNIIETIENIERRKFIRQIEKFEKIRNSMKGFDTLINQMHDKLESIKKQTQKIQMQNRLRLQGMQIQTSFKSTNLAANTKSFFELITDNNKTN